MLKRFGIEDCKAAATPIKEGAAKTVLILHDGIALKADTEQY